MRNNFNVGHFTPRGATVVPKNANEERTIREWEFFYHGYEASDENKANCVQSEATAEKISSMSTF